MTVHHLPNDQVVISSKGVWLPGIYATEAAARFAFQLTDAELYEISHSRGRGENYKPIVTEDLQAYRQDKRSG